MDIHQTSNFQVAVCITAYNIEKYIAKALDSVLSQITDFEFGVFVFEDQSSDKTWEILKDYKSNYPEKIFLHRNKQNLGMMPNYLQSLEKVDSPYIAVLDGDDFWTSCRKLQVQYNFLEQNSNYSLCWHDATFINSNEVPINTFSKRFAGREYDSEFDLSQVIRWKVLGATSSLFFRNYKFSFPSWTHQFYGTEVIIFIVWRQKGMLKYLHDNFSCYRVHSTSQEASLTKITKSLRNINEEKLLFSYFTPFLRGHFIRKILWNRLFLIVYSASKLNFLFALKMFFFLLDDFYYLILPPKNEAIRI